MSWFVSEIIGFRTGIGSWKAFSGPSKCYFRNTCGISSFSDLWQCGLLGFGLFARECIQLYIWHKRSTAMTWCIWLCNSWPSWCLQQMIETNCNPHWLFAIFCSTNSSKVHWCVVFLQLPSHWNCCSNTVIRMYWLIVKAEYVTEPE